MRKLFQGEKHGRVFEENSSMIKVFPEELQITMLYNLSPKEQYPESSPKE